MDELDSALGTEAPAELGRLDAGRRAELAGLVEAAVQRRAELLARAVDESLRYIPALLRGTVRRSLGL